MVGHSSLAAALCLLGLSSAYPAHLRRSLTTDVASVQDKSYDYIICGGGLTGLAVASRLSEDSSVSVLVIEGGGDDSENPMVSDVRTYGQAFGTYLDYDFRTTPVEWQDNATLEMVAGKTLGGSGSLNGASWTKGGKTQYDILPLLTGDDSWNFESFNQYMLRAENFNLPNTDLVEKHAAYDPEYHGTGGPVQVSFAQGMFHQAPALNASMRVWSGLENVEDVASGQVNGVTIIPNMLDPDVNQARSSPYTAYIKARAANRTNLSILINHRVTKINWKESSDAGLVASGVSFQSSEDSEALQVYANREVLLAAGSMQSPQLLELSGVGDPTILEPLNITVRHALPSVGKNLQEQTKNSLYFEHKFSATDFDGSGPASCIAYPNVHQLLGQNSSAVYNETISGLSAYTQMLKSKNLITNATATESILRAQVENLFIDSEAASEIFYTLTPSDNTVGIDAWNLIVLSRGSVHISSTNSFVQPIIEPSYFIHPLDLALQTASAMQSRQVYNTAPLSDYVNSEITPGLERVPSGSGMDVWSTWVKEDFTSVWHPIATLSMLTEDLGGAVNSKFQVYGLANVRAIDASVLPIQLSAHLSSSLYGIAEKAAESIKEDWVSRK